MPRINCCPSPHLTWQVVNTVPSTVPDGRLRANEVVPVFVLGCEMCSTTLMTVDAEAIAQRMTAESRLAALKEGSPNVH